jgi:predicted lipid-binding transport protein (Tim44 family)
MQRPFLRLAAGLLLATALWFVALTVASDAEARAPRGGRSFSGTRTFQKPPPPPSTAPGPGSAAFNRQPLGGGSPFMRGMAGGLLGGMLGGMLFGGSAHGAMGGIGGSGIGLIEILLFGGLAWFLFKRFVRPSGPRPRAGAFDRTAQWTDQDGAGAMDDLPAMPDIAPAGSRGIEAVRRSDPRFDPELFREGAQDLFFKIQAAWMRRDLSLVEGLIGADLAAEYGRQMAELKAQGRINRLENIAVRSVDIVDAGIDQGHAWITVEFNANLLDYTVDEGTGAILEGDPTRPVKFQERWTFAAPEGTSAWKLEGIA